jgi:hypothetical protein
MPPHLLAARPRPPPRSSLLILHRVRNVTPNLNTNEESVSKRDTLEQYVERLVKKHGTMGRVAAMIGMSLSAFSRGVQEEGTLSVENCLRLADAVGGNAGMILRLAGKPHVAEVMDRLAGSSIETLDKEERDLIYQWKTIDPDLQDLIKRTVAAFALQSQASKRRRRSGRIESAVPTPARRGKSRNGSSHEHRAL